MSMILYLLFSGSLYIWSSRGIIYDSKIPLWEYRAGIVVLTAFALAVWICDRSKKMRNGMMAAFILMNLGLSVAYTTFDRVYNPEKVTKPFQDAYAKDLLFMAAAFVVTYLVVRYTRVYRCKGLNAAVMGLIVLSFVGARVAKAVNGSHLTFAGVQVFAIVLLLYPFAAAYWLSRDENMYFKGDVTSVGLNLVSMLLTTFLVYAGCFLINEFGAMLIIAVTSTVLFWSNCRDKRTKLLYMLASFSGALLAVSTAEHVKIRFHVWQDPVAAYNAGMKQAAESVLFVFRNVNSTGWWGNGIGSLYEGYFNSLHNDHVLLLLGYDYSVLLCLLSIVLTALLVKWLLDCPPGICAYDRYLNLGCGLVTGCMALINIASVTGSFLTCGVNFPFISDGTSINVMLAAVMGIHSGVLMKGKVMSGDQT